MGLDNRKVFCAPGPKTKYFGHFSCCSINWYILANNYKQVEVDNHGYRNKDLKTPKSEYLIYLSSPKNGKTSAKNQRHLWMAYFLLEFF